MFPLLASLVTGGAGLIGSIFSSEQSGENTERNIAAQQAAQQQTMAFNADQANINRGFQAEQALGQKEFSHNEAVLNRNFQEQMSNSAYTRAMADMRQAGLNPILAARQGGASTPSGSIGSSSAASGATASVGTPNMALHNTRHALEGLGDVVSKAVSSAIQAKTFDKMTEEISNIQADTAKSKAAERLIGQQELTERQETDRRKFEKGKSEAQVMPEVLKKEEARAILDMPTWLRDMLVQSGFGGRKVSDTVSAVPMVASSARSLRELAPRRTTIERDDNMGRSSFEERFRGW